MVETQAKLNRGNVIDPRAGRITLAEYAAHWQAAQMHRPSTAEVTHTVAALRRCGDGRSRGPGSSCPEVPLHGGAVSRASRMVARVDHPDTW
jgi:hypothetical protein